MGLVQSYRLLADGTVNEARRVSLLASVLALPDLGPRARAATMVPRPPIPDGYCRLSRSGSAQKMCVQICWPLPRSSS